MTYRTKLKSYFLLILTISIPMLAVGNNTDKVISNLISPTSSNLEKCEALIKISEDTELIRELELLLKDEPHQLKKSLLSIFDSGQLSDKKLSVAWIVKLNIEEAYDEISDQLFINENEELRALAFNAAVTFDDHDEGVISAVVNEIMNQDSGGSAYMIAAKLASHLSVQSAIEPLVGRLRSSNLSICTIAAESLAKYDNLPETILEDLDSAAERAKEEKNKLDMIYKYLPGTNSQIPSDNDRLTDALVAARSKVNSLEK